MVSQINGGSKEEKLITFLTFWGVCLFLMSGSALLEEECEKNGFREGMLLASPAVDFFVCGENIVCQCGIVVKLLDFRHKKVCVQIPPNHATQRILLDQSLSFILICFTMLL